MKNNIYNLQVPKEHYFTSGYNHKSRWLTYYYQMDLLNKYNTKHVLEIGPGHGWMKAIVKDLGIEVETVDIDPKLAPDHIAPINDLPLKDGSFDAACAFEVLEHLPFETFKENLLEMARVSKRYIFISLPDHRHILFHARIKIPFLKYKEFIIRLQSTKKHVFDGQHYWEIGKKDFPVARILQAIHDSGLTVIDEFVPSDTPANHYFIMKK